MLNARNTTSDPQQKHSHTVCCDGASDSSTICDAGGLSQRDRAAGGDVGREGDAAIFGETETVTKSTAVLSTASKLPSASELQDADAGAIEPGGTERGTERVTERVTELVTELGAVGGEDASPARLYDINFFLAFTSQTCFVIANTLMAHYARWIEFLGGSLSQIGWVMGAGAAAGLFLRPWLAQFINRMGSKATWAMGYAVFSSAAFGNFWLEGIGPAIYVLRAATVLGAAMVFASSLTYVSQIAPDHRRTEAIGILGVGGFVGMLIGPLLGDLFLGSDARARYDFMQLFVAAGLANLIPGILLFFVRSPAKSPELRRASMKITEFVSTVREYWPGSIVWIDLAFGACMTVPFGFLASFVDEASLRIPGFSVVGFFFLFYAGVGILLRVGLRKLPDQVGPERVLLIGAVVMSAGMFAFGLVQPERAWLIALPALLCGAGHSLMFHTMTSLTIAPFPKQSRGTGSALALMLLDLGTFSGAPILGLIGDAWGYSVLFATVGLFCLLCTARFYAQGLRVAGS